MKPDLIICSDLHFREDTPYCRTDNYQKAQFEKFIHILELLYSYPKADLVCAGDFFDSPLQISFEFFNILTGLIITRGLCDRIFTIAGQHDLPNHTITNFKKTPLYSMGKTNILHIMKEGSPYYRGKADYSFSFYGYHFEGTPEKEDYKKYMNSNNERKVLILHQYTWCEGNSYITASPNNYCKKIMNKYSEYDLIITGDNHYSFSVQQDKQVLVNPGSMMRMRTDQIDHKPSVYLWEAKSNSIVRHYLPIQNNVIDTKHVSKEKRFYESITEFAENLKEGKITDIDFVNHCLNKLKEIKPSKSVEAIILDSLTNTKDK